MTADIEKSARSRNFDWEKMKSFYYITKLGSFSNAGRFLNMSQPALSRQIAYLEQHLGCPLFARHKTGVTLTRKGEELFKIVESTFLDLTGFTRNLHAEMNKGKKRKIRIASTHAIISYILDELIFDYNEQHPDLVFELIGDDHLIDIVMNDVDIAIRPYDPHAKGIQQDHLFTLEKKLYASPEYLKKYGEPKRVEDLKHHRIVSLAHPDEHPYADVNWILRLGLPEGEFHESVFKSTSFESLINAVNRGIGIISTYEEMSIIKKHNLKNILPEIKGEKIKCYFIFPEYLKEDKALMLLKNYLERNLLLRKKLSG